MKTEDNDVKLIWQITEDLKEVNALYFWVDLLTCALLGYGLFFYALFHSGLISNICFLVAVFFLYRGTMFIHEIAHFYQKIPGIRLAFNIFFGWANRFPAYVFDTHLFHHGKRTYGTKKDPEYKSMIVSPKWRILDPFLNSLLLPFFQVIRFVIIPLLTPFLGRKFQAKLYKSYSTLAMDLTYERKCRNPGEIQAMVFNDLMCSIYFITGLLLLGMRILPLKLIPMWYILMFSASLMNMYRAKFNHRYQNDLTEMNEEDHLLDCVTINGGLLTEICFPLSLSFHTLHHVVQDIPYHNLRKGHKRLIQKLPENHIYRRTVHSSIYSAAREHLSSLS